MKKLLLIICMVLASTGSQAASDDGVLIVGIGYTKPEIHLYAVHYKLANEAESWLLPDPSISYTTGDFFPDSPDFEGHETGKVVVKSLKPGKYEFYMIGLGMGTMYSKSRSPFSIPFVIKPGEATYVGDFTGVAEFSAPHLPTGRGYMVLSDQHERDVAIARKKMPDLGPVTIDVIDANALGTPLIRAGEAP